MKSLIYFFLTTQIFIFGCADSSLKYSLKKSGENKKEFKKVLDYYSVDVNDSLKFKAAVFLISNMPYHYALSETKIESASAIFDEIEKLNFKQLYILEDEKTKIAQSILNNIQIQSGIDVKMDHQCIESDYIIRNIEWAFKAWKDSDKKEHISFSDFCEYVLPYRVLTEPISYWRGELYNQQISSFINDTATNFSYYLNQHLNSTYYDLKGEKKFIRKIPFQMNFQQLKKSKSGICPQRCAYVIYHLRALGIPATFDFIPNWGNRNLDHSVVGLANRKVQIEPLLSNENKQLEKDNNISSAQSTFSKLEYSEEEIPDELYIQYLKTIPKVYRRTWSLQKEMLDIYSHVESGQIYTPLYNLTMKDVTDEYLENSEITLELPNFKNNIIYLSVFDTKNWIPVAAGKVNNNGMVCFKNMGTNIVYLPVRNSKGNIVPVHPPILLKPNHEIQMLDANKKETLNMKLVRKYPFFSNTAQYPRYFKQGWFEVSNNPEFDPSTTVYTVSNAPFFMNTIPLNLDDRYQYVRYCPPVDGRSDVAEIEIWGLNGKDTVKFNGTPIGNDSKSDNLALAFDGDYLTFFRPWGRNRWVGLEFPEKKKITKIRFCPRNGANCIIPGNEYELFIWENKNWKSFGRKTAKEDYLLYNDIPSGSLYWLKCLTAGKEERIFTYENNKQKWW